MDIRKYRVNFTYGSGVDETNFWRDLSFFIDDNVYTLIKQKVEAHSTTLYEWHDLSATPKEATNLVNDYIGADWFNSRAFYYFNNPETDPAGNIVVEEAVGHFNEFGIRSQELVQKSGTRMQSEVSRKLVNGEEPTNWLLTLQQYVQYDQDVQDSVLFGILSNLGNWSRFEFNFNSDGDFHVTLINAVLPSDFFLSEGVNPAYNNDPECMLGVTISGKCEILFPFDIKKVTDIVIDCATYNDGIYKSFTNVSLVGAMPTEEDISNPYGGGGISGRGGRDGTLSPSALDDVDPAKIPGLPGISAADLGFITMYNPTVAQLKSLSSFLWSGAFDLNTYKKLFSDPMQSVIGLAIVPVAPSIGGSKNVHFGSIDSGVSMSYLSTNYVQLDCGSVAVEKYVGCFMDNDPYTKISIYLPFIGIRQLSADDIIGGSIHVVYNIDVLTGACACFIEHSTRGVLYSYNGSCITNVPLTSVNFSGAIQNAVSAVGSMIGIAAGVATGAAPITAMSAIGLATSAANTALNSKPTVQRSGNLGGSAGILSIMTPYVIIERPSMSVPNHIQHYVGQTSNITLTLGACKGFTMCEFVHIDNVSATTEEILEIESLLKQGVIL